MGLLQRLLQLRQRPWPAEASDPHPWTGRDAMVLLLLSVLAYALLFAFEIGRLVVYGLPLELVYLDIRTSFNAWFWLLIPIMSGLTVLQVLHIRTGKYRKMRWFTLFIHLAGLITFTILLSLAWFIQEGWSIIAGATAVLMVFVYLFKMAYNWADRKLPESTRDRMMTFRELYIVAYHDVPLVPTRCMAVLLLILFAGAYMNGQVYELTRTSLYEANLAQPQPSGRPQPKKRPCLILSIQHNQYLCSPYDSQTNKRGNEFRIREFDSREALHYLDQPFVHNGRELLEQLIGPPASAIWIYVSAK